VADQHDYVLDNQTGANFRADLNLALLAIVQQNDGATAPATTYKYMWWADTANGLLKIRNGANGAWITVGDLTATNLGLLSLAGGTMTGVLAAAVGAVGAPGIAFSGDTDTGIYWISANKFALVANGAAVLTFDASNYPTFAGTKGILVPVGTTAQRPTGAAGIIRCNTDLTSFEGYNGSSWVSFGAGGGGGGIKWSEMAGTAPVMAEGFGDIVYTFAQNQELYTSIKVPQSYIAGIQIKLYISSYSASSSNTQLFKAQSTLITKNSSAFDSTTNQRTTTNAALTNTVAKQLREHVLDITDSSGQINSVAVAAGDVIKVRLYRDATDTDTADISMLPDATDVKFS
jgi:hypothetical protein